MKSAGRAIVIAALLISVGFHWAVLQSAAWAGMVVSFSQSGSLGEAVEKTFDGEHPCALCLAVESAKDHEDAPEDPAPGPKVKKLDLFSETVRPVVIARIVPSLLPAVRTVAWVSVDQDVEAPPPRAGV